jgi:predicted hydrocarbon binding protein
MLGRCSQCAENKAKVSQCEEELKAAKEATRESDTTIESIRLTLKEALKSGNASEAPAVFYNLACNLYEELYKQKCEEAERMRKAADEGAAESEKALCDVGHEFVEILIYQDFSKELAHPRYLKAEKAISEIMEREKRLIQQGVLDKSGIRKSQKHYCWILRELASIEKPDNPKAAEDKLKEVEAMHRSIWMRREEAKGLNEDNEWVLENGHQLGLVLAELKKAGEGHYSLAEIQLREVWDTRKAPSAFGPTHDDTVDSALQLVSMLEKQKKLDEKQKSADIEEILGGIWNVRSPGATPGRLQCGHKLGDRLYQQKKYADAETVLNQVWTTRTDALEQASKEADDARSTGYILASALYYQRTPEKYENAKLILKKLWGKRKLYMSKDASPSNDLIGWRLAWTYRMLAEYARAEPVFQSIYEMRKNDLGPLHPKTLTAQHELGLTQALRKRWAEAENTFQHIWDKRKDGTEGQSERDNTIARLRAGHQLGMCLSEQKSYKAAIKVLKEVYNGRVAVLEEDANETKTTKKALDDARKALTAQTEEEKANAEKTRAEARKQREKEEKDASNKAAREEALREEGREEIRDKIRGRFWWNK